MNGIVTKYLTMKGYGFIEPLIGKPGGKEVYFHASSVRGIKVGEQPGIPEGAEVTFDLVRGVNRPQAANLAVVKISAAALWPDNNEPISAPRNAGPE